jgi:hypothetical protein
LKSTTAGDELDLSNMADFNGGLSPVQRLDLINKKIKPDGRLVTSCYLNFDAGL